MIATRCHVAICTALALQMAGIGSTRPEDLHLGLIEYELSCMPCHGVDGHGNGPRAGSLKAAPTDLTKIAKSNNGVFPSTKVAEVIDGRAIVGAHGQREMPVWGDRYRVRVEAGEGTSEIDRRARAQIYALVEYLKRIQEK